MHTMETVGLMYTPIKQISLLYIGSGLTSVVENDGSVHGEGHRGCVFIHQTKLGIYFLWLEFYQINEKTLLRLLFIFNFDFVYIQDL